MTQNDVDKLLLNYRTYQARYSHLYLEAMNMALQINAETRRALAADAMHAQQYKDTPASGRISKPVEDLALRYMDGYMPEALKAWLDESEAMQRELRELETNMAYVDTWLNALTDKERLIITEHMLNGRTLKEMEIVSTRLLGYHMTADGIRGVKRKALHKIYDIAR